MKTATIRMKADDVAEILLYDQIGMDPFFGDGISAKTFREQVKGVKAKTINLRINSPGGSVFEGAAMLAALDDHPADIEVDVDGVAASAASVVAMGGRRPGRKADTVRMSANGIMMIHNPYGGVLGDADAMRQMAELLDKLKGQYLDSYMRRATVTRDELAKMMSEETWLTGKEAVDVGLADSVTEPLPMAACMDLSKFKYKHPPKMPGPSLEALAAHQIRKERLAKLVETPT